MLAEVNVAETKLTKPAWYQTTAKYAQSNLGRSLWQIFDTLVPYFALWAAMVYTVQMELPYWITLTLAVVAGSVLVRDFYLFPRLLPWILLCVAPGKRHLRLHHGYSDLYSV